MDDRPTITAVTIPVLEADAKSPVPDPGKAAIISAIPEIASSNAKTTAMGEVTRARLFKAAVRTANPPKKRRMRGSSSFTEHRVRGEFSALGPGDHRLYFGTAHPAIPPKLFRPACHMAVEPPKYPRHDRHT